MPVIVVGADTAAGLAILDRLHDRQREVRAFVTDEDIGLDLRTRGIKVATGDVSDDSHVEGAATSCFSAILITEAAFDDREHSFARTGEEVVAGWARAVEAARVNRVIWVTDVSPPETPNAETAIVNTDHPDLVEKVVTLDEAQAISNSP